MADFDGLISPAGSWMDIPQLSVMAIAIGGIGGCMNAQAVAIAARLELLRGRSVHGDQFPGIDPTGATDSTAGFVAAKITLPTTGVSSACALERMFSQILMLIGTALSLKGRHLAMVTLR